MIIGEWLQEWVFVCNDCGNHSNDNKLILFFTEHTNILLKEGLFHIIFKQKNHKKIFYYKLQ